MTGWTGLGCPAAAGGWQGGVMRVGAMTVEPVYDGYGDAPARMVLTVPGRMRGTTAGIACTTRSTSG